MDSDQTGITCIVTIHGIGFQQPPASGVVGYADHLHRHLHPLLGETLCRSTCKAPILRRRPNLVAGRRG
jgi:hypothetical protein